MHEITYELTCDDCGNEYSVVHLLAEGSIGDSPIYCPFCGSEVDLNFDDEHDDIDEVLDQLDELDFDDD